MKMLMELQNFINLLFQDFLEIILLSPINPVIFVFLNIICNYYV